MKVLGRLIIILVGLGFGALMGYHSWEQKWMQLAPVELELAEGSQEEILFETIEANVAEKLKGLQGSWLWEVNLSEIHKAALADERVQSASVSRVFPNRIRVSIEPHRPVFGLLDTKGRIHPVSTDGSLLPSISTSEVIDFPMLRGLQFFDDKKLRQEATALFKSLPETGVFSQANLSELRHSSREGFRLFLVEPEVQVLVGDSKLGPKTSRVEQVLRYLENRHVKGRIVDARIPHKVVVKVRE